MLSPRIETDRLILRRYEESDIDAIYKSSQMRDWLNILNIPI